MKVLFAGLLLAVAMTATALGQAQPLRIRGSIASLDGHVLTVTRPGEAPAKIALAPDYKVQWIVKSDFAHVVPGSFVGCAATKLPNGTLRAIEVHIFPPGVTPGAGSRPWDLGSDSVMTNGTVQNIAAAHVESVNAHTITIAYPDGKKTVVVPPSTPIVTYEKAGPSALVPGAHVIVFAVRKEDGSLGAAGVSVGKDGLIPPM